MEKEVERGFENVGEKINAMKAELASDIKDLGRANSKNEERIRNLETRTTINEQNIRTLCEDVRTIKGDTRWILRLIVGTLVAGGIALLMKSGGGS